MPEQAVTTSLIPHGAAARMVETILDVSAGSVVCRGRVPLHSAFASGEGRVPAVVTLELAAQAAAVHRALGPATGAADRGYLVRVRAAVLHAPEVAAGAPLVAAVRLVGTAGPLATYDVVVTGPDGETILTATLATHRGR